MRALITGANGFLGGWLARQLLARGDQVRAMVRSGHEVGPLAGQDVEIVAGDVTDPPERLAPIVRGCDVVFHLAGIRRSPNRADFMRVNVDGTRNLLEACVAAHREHPLRRFILVGSLAAAGPSRDGRRESDPMEPTEWYGESKAEAERLTLSYASRLPVSVARPPRIVGPGDRENLFFFKMVKKGFVLSIWGEPRTLSWIDVEDCARGLIAMADNDAANGQAFFLASSERTSLAGLQLEVAKVLGSSPRVVALPPPFLSGAAAIADVVSNATGKHLPLNRKLAKQLLAPGWTCTVEKARDLLGFTANVSLHSSIEASTRWYEKNGLL
jgi:nucleoside-diphosphate-sugar epimerase